MTTEPVVQLSGEQRTALSKELFRRWEADSPGTKCFCGSDEDLVKAVERLRDEQDRERG